MRVSKLNSTLVGQDYFPEEEAIIAGLSLLDPLLRFVHDSSDLDTVHALILFPSKSIEIC